VTNLPSQFSVPADLVEHILLGPADDRRMMQDSPLLGDVWTAYAFDAGATRDVLITPHKNATAALVASRIPDELTLREKERVREKNPAPTSRKKQQPKIAYLQGLVAARLYFDEVLRVLVPMSHWWLSVKGRIDKVDPDKLTKLLRREVYKPGSMPRPLQEREIFTSLERYIALAGLIYWIGKLERVPDPDDPDRLPPITAKEAFEAYRPHADQIVAGILALFGVIKVAALAEARKKKRPGDSEYPNGTIFQVSLNRIASAALERSVPAVKADAARSLFKVNCEGIIWAVLDAGIDGTHNAFLREAKEDDESGEQRKVAKVKSNRKTKRKFVSRVTKTFDFTKIREIVSAANALTDDECEKLAQAAGLSTADAKQHLTTIASNAKEGLPINWAIVEKLITVKKPELPATHHGTHVAGIIGADGSGAETESGYSNGMCPDIGLYDFRVLGGSEEDTEFSVISALQYIRYVNERHNYIIIHGANLSLSIPHSVSNFACGRTPVCNECERLVESGVVVVAAAGNHGHQKFQTENGPFESYAAFSITDPGNRKAS
jgi:serine protease AprX